MQKNGYRSSRKIFPKKLTLDFATPYIQSRLFKSKVRKSVREIAAQMGISTPAVTKELQHSLNPNLPKEPCTRKTLAGSATHVGNISMHLSICNIV